MIRASGRAPVSAVIRAIDPGEPGPDPGDPGDVPMDGPGDAPGEWCSVRQAARRLGITEKAVRGRVERGTMPWRPNGNHGRLVLVPVTSHGSVPGDDPPDIPEDGSGDIPPGRPREVELLERIAALGERAAKAEGELAAEQRRNAELREALSPEADHPALERVRGDRLEAEALALARALAETRRPWLAKVLEALRRKGS